MTGYRAACRRGAGAFMLKAVILFLGSGFLLAAAPLAGSRDAGDLGRGRLEPTTPLVLLLVIGCVAAGQLVLSLSLRVRFGVAFGTTALAGLALAWLHLLPGS